MGWLVSKLMKEINATDVDELEDLGDGRHPPSSAAVRDASTESLGPAAQGDDPEKGNWLIEQRYAEIPTLISLAYTRSRTAS